MKDLSSEIIELLIWNFTDLSGFQQTHCGLPGLPITQKDTPLKIGS